MAANDAHNVQYGFAVADYVVFALNIALSLGVGVFYGVKGRDQTTTVEYLLGNRSLRVIPVAVSLAVTFQSSVVLLGLPAEVYIYGYIGDLVSVGLGISFIIGGRIIVPLLHPLKIASIYEYLELRYNSKGPRYLGTCIGMLNYIFYMSIVLCGPALTLEAVLGFPTWISFIVTAAVSVSYTSVGGLRAVIWTDVVQCMVMIVGVIGIIIKGTVLSGGLYSVLERNQIYGRFNMFEMDPSIRHTFWSVTIGSICLHLNLVFSQSTIQRICSVKTKKEGRRLLYFAVGLLLVTEFIISTEGIISFAYFNHLRCDPLESKQISNPNQILPFMVLRIFHDLPGLSGLFIASLFSGVLSTLSSGYTGLAVLLTEDFVKPNFKQLSEAKITTVAKCSVPVFGILTVGLAYLMVTLQGSLMQMFGSLTAAFGGPLVGMFIYSVFFPWATKQGAVVGSIISMALVFWISLGQNLSTTLVTQPWLPPSPIDQCYSNTTLYEVTLANYSRTVSTYSTSNRSSSIDTYEKTIEEFWNYQPEGLDKLYSLSYMWLSALGMMITIVVGSIVSLIVGSPENVDSRYMLPLGDTLFPYLPAKIRTYLSFGVNYNTVKVEREVVDGILMIPLSSDTDDKNKNS